MSQQQETYERSIDGRPARNYTYTNYAVRQIMPAVGWHSVYYEETTGEHEASPVYALALVHPIVRERETRDIVMPTLAPYLTEAEDWDVVGLEYDHRQSEGWVIPNECVNYCGLLPPGGDLETFAAQCPVHRT